MGVSISAVQPPKGITNSDWLSLGLKIGGDVYGFMAQDAGRMAIRAAINNQIADFNNQITEGKKQLNSQLGQVKQQSNNSINQALRDGQAKIEKLNIMLAYVDSLDKPPIDIEKISMYVGGAVLLIAVGYFTYIIFIKKS